MAVLMNVSRELFNFLLEKTGISSQELERRLTEKIESLGHLVNEDVALRLLARDLNVSLTEDKMIQPHIQIADLVPNMNNVSLELEIESVGALKEFLKKDRTQGKVLKVLVSDPSGDAYLVGWDGQAEQLAKFGQGTKIIARCAYTKSGLDGKMEIHLGNRSRMDLLAVSNTRDKTSKKYAGRIWRTSDPLTFERRDGSQGTLATFQLKGDSGIIRVLIWNPRKELLSDLKEGVFVEIINAIEKKDINGKPEVHVNDAESIIIHQDNLVEIKRDLVHLSKLEPGMDAVDVEATVEVVFDLATTYNGKSFLKMLIRDNETILPVTIWNDKAKEIFGRVQKGSKIRLENCYVKLGYQGLELGVSRWSRVLIIK